MKFAESHSTSPRAVETSDGEHSIDRQLIEAQLAKILRSAEFARSARMARFLRHIVQSRIEGRSEFGKERSIGVEVFDRPPDWDPKIDTIVRSEARRLRNKLEQYYETSQGDVVRFTLPKGGYYPDFELLPGLAGTGEPEPKAMAAQWQESAGEESAPGISVGPGTARWRRFAVPFLIGLSVVAALLSVTFRLPRVPQKADAFEIVPFANEIGTEMNPAISPDGQSIAYAWDGNDGNFDIYIKNAAGGPNSRPRRVTDSAGAEMFPAWSPDGRSLTYLRVEGRSSALILMNLITGEERRLRPIGQSATGWAGENRPLADIGPSWMPDGRSIVFSDTTATADHQENSTHAIYSLNINDGQEGKILETPPGVQAFFPRVAADGKHVAFVRYVSHGVSDLYICNADGSGLRRLTNDGREITGLTWSPNSDSLYFTSWHNGSSRIWRIGVTAGSHPEPLPDASSAEGIAVSPHGEWIAYAYLIENWNIWRMPLSEANSTVTLGEPKRFIASSGRNHGPSFSPDGEKLAFISDRSGSWQIWLADPDGSNVRQISQADGSFLGSVNWTPDSKTIAFDARPSGNSNIYLLDVLSGGVPRPFAPNHYEERMPSFSADGKSIYFNSNRDGAIAVWKTDLRNGSAVKVGHAGSFKSLETPSGQLLLSYVTPSAIDTANVDGSQAQRLAAIHPMPDLNWIPTARTLYYTEQLEDGQIGFRAYRDGKSFLLTTIPGRLIQNTSNLAVSPDRHWLLYAQCDQSTSDIVIRRVRRGGQP